jgi:hypothetical protein
MAKEKDPRRGLNLGPVRINRRRNLKRRTRFFVQSFPSSFAFHESLSARTSLTERLDANAAVDQPCSAPLRSVDTEDASTTRNVALQADLVDSEGTHVGVYAKGLLESSSVQVTSGVGAELVDSEFQGWATQDQVNVFVSTTREYLANSLLKISSVKQVPEVWAVLLVVMSAIAPSA